MWYTIKNAIHITYVIVLTLMKALFYLLKHGIVQPPASATSHRIYIHNILHPPSSLHQFYSQHTIYNHHRAT